MAGVFDHLDYQGFSDVIGRDELCFLYTDGVTEAQDEAGGFFGPERLVESLASMPGPRPAEAVEAVLRRIRDFQGRAPQADDITILAFTRG
jgi:sigma-B regulation protein RsbU (phosphoserine phosphatase)